MMFSRGINTFGLSMIDVYFYAYKHCLGALGFQPREVFQHIPSFNNWSANFCICCVQWCYKQVTFTRHAAVQVLQICHTYRLAEPPIVTLYMCYKQVTLTRYTAAHVLQICHTSRLTEPPIVTLYMCYK
jgi:hypothetical protein